MIDLLRDIEEYIAAMEVAISSEWGSSRDAAKLEADGDMPHLLFRVRGAIAALAAAAPAAPSRGPLTAEEIFPGFDAYEKSESGRHGATVWLSDFTAGVRFAERAHGIGVTDTNGDPHGE